MWNINCTINTTRINCASALLCFNTTFLYLDFTSTNSNWNFEMGSFYFFSFFVNYIGRLKKDCWVSMTYTVIMCMASKKDWFYVQIQSLNLHFRPFFHSSNFCSLLILGVAKRYLWDLGAESWWIVASLSYAKMIPQWDDHFGRSKACYDALWLCSKAPKIRFCHT